MAEQSIAERLRDVGCDREPFTPQHAKCICRLAHKAAEELDRLTKERDAARLGRDILRQQLRDAGIEPLITE